MESGLAVCPCTEPHSVFDVCMKLFGVDFEEAKIRVVSALGHENLIVDPTAAAGLTLEEYTQAKKLPLDWLVSHFRVSEWKKSRRRCASPTCGRTTQNPPSASALP